MHKYDMPKWCSKVGAKMEVITKITIQEIENSKYTFKQEI